MKKYLIIGFALVTVFSMWAVGVSAVSIGSQSIDVTVGEVDTISGDDEEQSFIVPDTGANTKQIEMITSSSIVLFATVIVMISFGVFAVRKSKE